jgi:membrane-associated protease RseP (regulator of RpoE activity)
MIEAYSPDDLLQQIEPLFEVGDITWGGVNETFIVRYRGKLRNADSEKAYDFLSEAIKRYDLTPLFRIDEDRRQVIYLAKTPPKAKPSNANINLILFIVTVLSVLFAGVLYGSGGAIPQSLAEFWTVFFSSGLPFTVSMIAILGTHELGHYFVGKYHKVMVTLPYFIPMPFSAWGTMGAFINMKEQTKNKKHLFDIGVAGPLSGFVVSLLVLFIGLKLSHIETIPAVLPVGTSYQLEGNSLAYLFMKYLAFGKLLPQPAQYWISPFMHWARFFFTATPLPLGGIDVIISPVAWAGWAGLLVTSLNLIPAGQLDGGHIFQVLFGRNAAKRLRPIILVALVSLGLIWYGWWLWAILVFFFGRAYAEPLDQITPLDRKRKILGYIALAVLFLTITPVPFTIASGIVIPPA